MKKNINSILDVTYVVENENDSCGDCNSCKNHCEFGSFVLRTRIGVGA